MATMTDHKAALALLERHSSVSTQKQDEQRDASKEIEEISVSDKKAEESQTSPQFSFSLGDAVKPIGKSATVKDPVKLTGRQKTKRIFWSLVAMPILVWLHLKVCLYVVMSSFVTMTMPTFVILGLIGVYLYYSLSRYVRMLYFRVCRWKPAIYTVLYYLLFTFEYYLSYFAFLGRVRTEHGYIFETEGAFLSYVYKIFPLVIIAHLMLAFIRWLFVKIIGAFTKKKDPKSEVRAETEKLLEQENVKSKTGRGRKHNSSKKNRK